MKPSAIVLLFFFAVCQARASRPVPNFPYVQSMQMGVVYARCIPDGAEGAKGTTRIYRVGRDRDELLDRYDWYAKDGLTLAWSPLAGKVAVMALGGAPDAGPGNKTELSFFLGGKLLSAYTSQDLKAWGADVWQRGGRGAIFRVVGEEQIPGTNEYVFSIEIKGKKQSFDILTGKPYLKAKGEGAAQ